MQEVFGTELGPLSAVLMGITARTTTVIFMQPLTLIKTRYEVHNLYEISIDALLYASTLQIVAFNAVYTIQ